ncbi:Lissencephaly-1 [Hypoxylon texense]
MEWFSHLPHLVSECTQSVEDLPSHVSTIRSLKTGIADLYSSIILFEIGIVCSCLDGQPPFAHKSPNATPNLSDIACHSEAIIRGLEDTLASSLDQLNIKSQLQQLFELAQNERHELKQKDSTTTTSTETTRDEDEQLTEEELLAILTGLDHIEPQNTIPNLGAKMNPVIELLSKDIISREEFVKLTESNPKVADRVLWIKGAPGSGKTIAVVAYAQHLLQRERENAGAAGLVFYSCGHSDGVKVENSTSVLKNLIWQILKEQPLLIDHLRNKARSTKRRHLDDPNDFYAMLGILFDMLDDERFVTTYFIIGRINAIEEADGLKDILGLIASTSKFSPKVKWIISVNAQTGSEALPSTYPEKFSHFTLDSKLASRCGAIDEYIGLKVGELAAFSRYEETFRAEVTAMLKEKSSGNFLWASMACKIIKSTSTPWNASHILRTLPSTVEDLFKHARNEIRQRLWDAEYCNSVLNTATIACRPLSISELISINALPLEVDIKILVGSICFSFLEIRKEKVYFTNQAAKEFLKDDMGPKGLSDSHTDMALRCLRIAFQRTAEVNGSSSPVSAKYAMLYWGRHLSETQDEDSTWIMEEAASFLEQYLLQWVDALISTGLAWKAPEEMRRLERSLRVSRLLSLHGSVTLS